MTSEERLTVSRPEDILGFVPHALGYWPQESLVAMTLQGKTLGATLRVDLPPPGPEGSLALFATRIGEYLAADDQADGVLLALFTDRGWDDASIVSGTLPLLDALREALADGGLPVKDAWLVGGGYWRSAYCTDLDCCPMPGRPAAEISDSRLNAEMVYRGSSIGESPGLLDAFTAVNRPGDSCLVLQAEEKYLEQLLPWWRNGGCFDMVLKAWQEILASSGALSIPPEAQGFLRATLRIPSWRDAVVVMAAAGIGTARAGADSFGLLDDGGQCPLRPPAALLSSDSLGGEGGTDVEQQGGLGGQVQGYGEVLLGLEPPLPDWSAMEALENALTVLCSSGGGEAGAASLTVRGWIEWCRGRGSFAGALFREAQSVHPGYRLAELLTELLHRGTICGWAQRREASWRRFGERAA